MSKINVDTWEPESGTAATLMATGDTVTVPSGATLRIGSGAIINITDATQTGFPSAGFSDVDSDTTSGSETYTVPTDITKLLVIITGGGGGGAGGAVATGYPAMSASGATTVLARVTVVADDTITIAIGAGGAGGGDSAAGTIGGDSTFTHASGSGSGSMSTITAPGGKPGTFRSAITAPAAGTVGTNNEGISILGGWGSKGGANHATGLGGASFWGGGGMGGNVDVQTTQVGPAYGSGGGGGTGNVGYITGAAGGDGVCFIMEFK